MAHRRDLRAVGVGREDVRAEVSAGRWSVTGRHPVIAGRTAPAGRALLWTAVWESGPMAVLDGASAVVAAGLTGLVPVTVDVSIPHSSRRHLVEGMRSRGRRHLGPVIRAGLPRARPEWATIRAAQWARTDREAALVVCLTAQQRLVHPERLFATWLTVRGGPRHRFLGHVVRDVCDGAHSLGELDVASLCRRAGLPPPSRQVVRTTPTGRVYLDLAWEDVGLVVEVDGGHHALALDPVDDALRQNVLAIDGELVLRVPVIGLRLRADDLLAQIVRAHRALAAGAA